MQTSVPFETFNKNGLSNMSAEERESEIAYYNKFLAILEENILYKTTCKLIRIYSFLNYCEPVTVEDVQVTLFRRVNYETLQVDDQLKLKVHASPWVFNYSKEFVNEALERINNDDTYGICVDELQECYISAKETKRLVTDINKVLAYNGIPLERDFKSRNRTESDAVVEITDFKYSN